MKKHLHTVRNENGSAIILVLLVLAILTVIGISATNTSDVELSIAGNDRIHRTTFYAAESGLFSTAKLVSETLNDSALPTASGAKNGIVYEDTTDAELYDEVIGQDDALGANSYDAAADISLTLGDSAMVAGTNKVGLSELSVSVDLRRMGVGAGQGESAEFGTGADGLGTKTIVVIPYQLTSTGQNTDGTTAITRSFFYKYVNKPGGI